MSLRTARAITIAAALFWCVQLPGQNPANPIQDALLRWYPANTTAQFTEVLSSASPSANLRKDWLMTEPTFGWLVPVASWR
jgi:hypothetical protein